MSDQKPGQGSKPVNEETQRLAVANRIEELRRAFDTLQTTKSGRVIRNASDLPDDPADWPAYILWPLVPGEKLNAYLRFHGITDDRVLSAVCDAVPNLRTLGAANTPQLAEMSRANLLRYESSTTVSGDGTRGHTEAAPYDVIVLAAATPKVPPKLWEQLNQGGTIAVPIVKGDSQELKFIRKMVFCL